MLPVVGVNPLEDGRGVRRDCGGIEAIKLVQRRAGKRHCGRSIGMEREFAYHAGRGGDDAREAFGFGTERFPQFAGFLNIGVGSEPFHDQTARVSNRHRVGFEPAINAVAAPEAALGCNGAACRQRVGPIAGDRLQIVRVQVSLPSRAQ